MLNDFIGGGQIFLHKIRMFMQVAGKSMSVATLVAAIGGGLYGYPKLQEIDLKAALTYQKAKMAITFSDAIAPFKRSMHTSKKPFEMPIPLIDAYTEKKGLYLKDANSYIVLRSKIFTEPYEQVIALLIATSLIATITFFVSLVIILIIWSKYGAEAKESKHLSGSIIQTAKEVALYLRRKKLASDFKIGNMPLVKDSETRHMLVTGMTGSGKTNLINTLLPQVRRKNQPALVIDQTGEMIAKYYDPTRGDIIFNPFDSRGASWDFWADATSEYSIGGIDSNLEKFAEVLFKFGKSDNSNSDPFWDNSAKVVFCACVETLIKENNKSLPELKNMLANASMNNLGARLANTKAARYLTSENKNVAGSILSVLSTNTKPLQFLLDLESKFSLKEYFSSMKGSIDNGTSGNRNSNGAWLFFSSPPNQREVVMPIISCLFDLAISYLIDAGINEKRRIWFIIDELAALGKLNGLSTLLNESRKYGGCVLAATQSISQMYNNFGHHLGSAIFGQFATKFFFRNDEGAMAKFITETFGQQEYTLQQRNTSYGAHEHRDGVSYTEQERRKALISSNDLATLANLECFVGLPEAAVRVARIKIPPVASNKSQVQGFIPLTDEQRQELSNANLINSNATVLSADIVAANAAGATSSTNIGINSSINLKDYRLSSRANDADLNSEDRNDKEDVRHEEDMTKDSKDNISKKKINTILGQLGRTDIS